MHRSAPSEILRQEKFIEDNILLDGKGMAIAPVSKDETKKTGYLMENFRIFRLKDRLIKEIPAHYHDFHKLIILLDGKGDYLIDGRSYPLSPRDLILVPAWEMHRPLISSDHPYERIVIYFAPAFLSMWQDEAELSCCFSREHSRVMQLTTGHTHDLLYHIMKLEAITKEDGFAQALYVKILFLEFLILLNRAIKNHELGEIEAASCDPKIQELLGYIASHLTDDLSIPLLADRIHLSKFHLMRKFKGETGYSLHQYIRTKRLLLAKSLLSGGSSITDICYETGFQSYSSFSRGFKEMFHSTPKEWQARTPSLPAYPVKTEEPYLQGKK